MKQFVYGLLIYLFLCLPPVANLMESIMIVHMHTQMPLLVLSGCLMAQLFRIRYPRFFEQWNENGVPGILLFIVVMAYWSIPRTMDETLTYQGMEIFKFLSLPFLAGVPLRDSWNKLSKKGKDATLLFFTIKFLGMGLLYVKAPNQLCNNYLKVDQITLGWGFLTTSICLALYLIYAAYTARDEQAENS